MRVQFEKGSYRRRRLTLEHWSGATNSSDGLTKSWKLIDMWISLCDAVWLVPGLSADKAVLLSSHVADVDDELLTDARSVREGEFGHRVHFLAISSAADRCGDVFAAHRAF